MSHHTHQTRFSDSSHYDIRCVRCGATDGRGSSALDRPCPDYRCGEEEAAAPAVVSAATDARALKFKQREDVPLRCTIASDAAANPRAAVAARLSFRTELDVDGLVSKVLAELRGSKVEGVVVAREETLEKALRSALGGAAARPPEGFLVVPAEPHPQDLSYAAGLSDLSDVSAHPPSGEATERELRAFYRTRVGQGAMRVR